MVILASLSLDRFERVAEHWVGDRPRYAPERCTSARHDRATCRSCESACPAAALRIGADRLVDIVTQACTGCDACVAACPTGALASRSGAPTSPVVSCSRSARRTGGSVVTCAGGIGPARLLVLAAAGDVEIVTGECESCPLAAAGAGMTTSVARTNDVLEELGLPQRVRIQVDLAGEAAPAGDDVPAISRRSFFRSAGRGACTSVAVALAAEPERDVASWADPERDGQPCAAGAGLASLLAAAEPGATVDTTGLGAGVPHVSAACDGCGVCAAFCPTAALRLRSDEDGHATLLVDARACVACGLCETICPQGAVTVAREVSARELPGAEVPVWSGSARRAERPSGPITTATAFWSQLPPVAGSRSQGAEP